MFSQKQDTETQNTEIQNSSQDNQNIPDTQDTQNAQNPQNNQNAQNTQTSSSSTSPINNHTATQSSKNSFPKVQNSINSQHAAGRREHRLTRHHPKFSKEFE